MKVAKFFTVSAALKFTWFVFKHWRPAIPIGKTVYYIGWLKE